MMANRFIIAGAIVALLSTLVIVTGVRRGRIHLRGPYGRVDRHHKPVLFWSSIAVSGLAALSGLAMATWGILQKL
jgi:hypothetical protein